MRTAIATLLVAAMLVFAGCAGSDQREVETDAQEGTTVDNDAGAEPINPDNGTGNGTDDGFAGMNATANGTATAEAGGG